MSRDSNSPKSNCINEFIDPNSEVKVNRSAPKWLIYTGKAIVALYVITICIIGFTYGLTAFIGGLIVTICGLTVIGFIGLVFGIASFHR